MPKLTPDQEFQERLRRQSNPALAAEDQAALTKITAPTPLPNNPDEAMTALASPTGSMDVPETTSQSVEVEGIKFDAGIPAGSAPEADLTYIEQENRARSDEYFQDRARERQVVPRLQSLLETGQWSEQEVTDAFLYSLIDPRGRSPEDLIGAISELKKSDVWAAADWGNIARRYPAATSLILDGPIAAQKLALEVKPLSWWEDWFGGRWGGEHNDIQITRSWAERTLDAAVARPALNALSMLGEWGKENAAKIESQEKVDLKEASGLQSLLTGTVSAAGFLATNIAGTEIGALVGGGIAGLAGPEAVPAGAWVGGVVGDVVTNILTGTRDLERQLQTIDGMDDGTARSLAMMGAGIQGIIGRFGTQAIAQGYKATTKSLGLQVAERTFKELTQPSRVGSFVKGYSKAQLHAAATMAGMASVGALTYELGQAQATGDLGAIDLDEVALKTVDGVLQGMKDFALLSLVPGFRRVADDQRMYQDTLGDLTAAQMLVTGVEQTKLKQQPGLMKAVLDRMGERAGGKRLWTWITKDAASKFADKEGTSFEAVARELGATDEDILAAEKTGDLKVQTSVFLDKIIATGKLPDFAADLKWDEAGRTVRELNTDVTRLLYEADKQFKEPRRIEVKGADLPPAKAVQEDIEFALLKMGSRKGVAKGVAEAFAHYFAMLSVKSGKVGEPDWDAYSLWARNPLWFRLSGGQGQGGEFLNPYTRTAHEFASSPTSGVPFARALRSVPDIAERGARDVDWDFGRFGPEEAGIEFHLLRGDTSGLTNPQEVVSLGLAGNADGILYVASESLAKGEPWYGLTAKAAAGTKGAKIISRKQLQNLMAKGGKGKVYVIDPVVRGAIRGVDPTDPEGGLMPAAVTMMKNPRWLTLDQFGEEYRVAVARAGRTDLGDAAGLFSSSKARPERGGLDPDGTAYMTDFNMAFGRDASRAAERLTEVHEMTHYADAVFLNTVSELKDRITPRLEEDFRELQAWAGIPSLDAAGKPLSAYQMAQLKMAAAWMQNRAGEPGEVSAALLAEAQKRFPRAPLEGLTPEAATLLGKNERSGSERLAYAFQAFVANGKSSIPRLESAFTRMAQYAWMYQQYNVFKGAEGIAAIGASVLADNGSYDLSGFAERTQPYGGPDDVATAFNRFFAADNALIGVGANNRLSPLIAIKPGETPGYEGFPQAHGATGEAGRHTVKASGKDFKKLFGFDEDAYYEKKGPTPDKKLTPEEEEKLRRAKNLGTMQTPQERAEARRILIEKLKDAENAIHTPGGADLKGKRKIRYEVNQEREKLTEQVKDDVRNDPTARALVAIGGRLDHLPPEQKAAIEGFTKAGIQFRLDYEATKAKYGQAVADGLPDYMYARGRKKDRTSVDLETMTGVFGLEPDVFLERAQELRSFRDYIDRTVQGRLMLQFAEILTDPAALFDKALEVSFNNDRSVEKAIEQWRELAHAIGDEFFIARADHATLDGFRRTAAKWVSGDRQLWRLQPEQIAKAQQKQWQKAFESAVAGDLKGAFEAKEKQLWLHTLYLAAEERREQMDKLRADLEGRMTRDAYRSKLGKATPVLREVHDGLLELVGLREPKPGEESYAPVLLARLRDVVDYAKNKAQVLMFDPKEVEDLVTDVAGRIASQKSAGPTIQARRNAWSNWSYLTVDEALAVERIVKQVAHWAKEETAYRKEGEAMEIADMTKTLQDDIAAKHLPELESGHYVFARSVRRKWTEKALDLQAWDGNLTETETMLGMVSDNIRDSIMSEFRAARGRRDNLAAMIHGWWDQNWLTHMSRREVRQRMMEKIDLKKYGLDIKFDPKRVEDPISQDANRSVAMMIALHMGNPENEWRLLQGYGWEKDNVLKMLGEVLSKEELAFVQKTWDFFNQNLWPFVKDKAERQTGLPLKAVKAASVEIPHPDGSWTYLDGGYFPAKYDRNLATREQTLHATDTDIGYYYKGDYSRQVPYTYKGHTKARTPGYYDRLSLDFGILSGHLVQVVHDIAFDDFVKNTGKLFADHDFNATLVRYLGSERVLQLQDWLWGVANGYVENTAQSQRRIVQQFQALRDKTVLGILGHSVGVAMGDLTNVPVAIAAGRVSIRNALGVSRDLGEKALWSRDLDVWYEELRNKSTVVNTRSQHWVLELRKRMQDPLRGETWAEAVTSKVAGDKAAAKVGDTYDHAIDRVRETAFFLQQAIDKYSSIVIWEGAYRDAEGMPEQERIKHADKMLEDTLPGLEKMNQAGILRTRNIVGSLLLFYGYFNKLFNILRGDAHSKVYEPYLAAKAGEIGKGEAAWSSTKYAGEALALFFITNVVAEWASGRGKDDRETMSQYLTRKMLAAPLTMLPFGAPVGEVVGNYVSGSPVGKGIKNQNFSMRQSPQMALIEQLGRLGGEIVDTAEGKRSMDKGAFSLLEAYLYANGLPARQWRRTSQYLYDAFISERYPPQSVGDVLSGVAYGQRKRQPGNPFRTLGQAETGELWR